MGILFKQMMDHIREVILRPKDFWEDHKRGDCADRKFLLGYFSTFIFFVAMAAFLGEFLRSNHFYAGYALLKSFREILLFSLTFFISVFFTNELMKTFGGKKNYKVAQGLVLFSLTPLLLVSIITGLFPFLYVMDVLGFYSCYIFWLGAKEMLDFPGSGIRKYSMMAILVNFFVFSFFSIFLSKLLTAYI